MTPIRDAAHERAWVSDETRAHPLRREETPCLSRTTRPDRRTRRDHARSLSCQLRFRRRPRRARHAFTAGSNGQIVEHAQTPTRYRAVALRRGAHRNRLDAVARETNQQERHHLVVQQVAREARGPGGPTFCAHFFFVFGSGACLHSCACS